MHVVYQSNDEGRSKQVFDCQIQKVDETHRDQEGRLRMSGKVRAGSRENPHHYTSATMPGYTNTASISLDTVEQREIYWGDC